MNKWTRTSWEKEHEWVCPGFNQGSGGYGCQGHPGQQEDSGVGDFGAPGHLVVAWLPWEGRPHLEYQLSLPRADHSFHFLFGSQLCRDRPGILCTPLRPDLLHTMHRYPQLVQVHQAPVSTSLRWLGRERLPGPLGLPLYQLVKGPCHRCGQYTLYPLGTYSSHWTLEMLYWGLLSCQRSLWAGQARNARECPWVHPSTSDR